MAWLQCRSVCVCVCARARAWWCVCVRAGLCARHGTCRNTKQVRIQPPTCTQRAQLVRHTEHAFTILPLPQLRSLATGTVPESMLKSFIRFEAKPKFILAACIDVLVMRACYAQGCPSSASVSVYCDVSLGLNSSPALAGSRSACCALGSLSARKCAARVGFAFQSFSECLY